MNWYIIKTEATQEPRALMNLYRQRFRPLYWPRYRHNGKIKSLFPGYIFLGGDPENWQLWKIRSTRGCRGLLCIGDKPATIRNQEIDDLRSRETTEGLVSFCQFKPNDPILWGIIPAKFLELVDEQRVMILYSMLGRENRKLVPLSSVCSAVPA